MGNKRIKDLEEKLSVSNDDYFVLEDSADGYKTRKIKGQNVSSNFANTNLTFTADRTHDIGSYTLTFDGTTRVISPGATAGDTAFVVRNSTDTADMFIQNGAGKIGINTSPLTYARMYISAGTNNYGIYVDASDELAGRFDSVSNRGILASSSSNKGIESTSTSSYGGHFKSQDNYAVWSQSTGAGTQYSILSNGQCDFKNYADTLTIMILKNDGKINMPNLPTSSAGLSAGDLWNNSGVINIV